MTKLTITEDLEKKLLQNIISFFKNNKTYSYKQIAKVTKQHLDISFKKLILLKPLELKKIVNDLNNSTPISMNKDRILFEDLYKKFRNSVNGKKFIRNLDLNVCVYCNRNYIFNFNKKSTSEATAQLDHFFDKSSYPYIALSVYNLIPSCSTCNQRKSSQQKDIIYPYLESFNDNMKFSYKFTNEEVNFFHKDKIQLLFDIKGKNKKVENYLDIFNIKYLYENHKDIVLELIQKREIYPDSYIDELMKNYSGTIFSSRDELMRLITCGYVNDEDINKRPLSKLIKDISEELDFV